MSEPIRWRSALPSAPEGSRERHAAELFQKLDDVEPWENLQKQQVLREIRAKLEHLDALPPSRTRWFWAVGSLSLAALVAALWLPKHPQPSSLPSSSEVVVASADAHYQLGPEPVSAESENDSAAHVPPQPQPLKVDSGTLQVHRAEGVRTSHAVALSTPHLKADIEAVSFRVQVAGEVTTLWVDNGHASVAGRNGQVVLLESGQWVRSDDARFAAPASTPRSDTEKRTLLPSRSQTSEEAAKCAPLAGVNRQRCYTDLALGNDQAAQNALVELGMIELDEHHDGPSAIAYWRAYQHRFPEGSLGPEASFAILSELLAEHRTNEAATEAEQFLAQFPDDARKDEVRLTRANLRCTSGASPSKTLSGFDELLKQSNAAGRGEALFARGVCAQRLGLNGEARNSLHEYLSAFPDGPHAAEARTLVGNE
jgi:outer membrane protein assembly factor BamD (BamD/ComL family)